MFSLIPIFDYISLHCKYFFRRKKYRDLIGHRLIRSVSSSDSPDSISEASHSVSPTNAIGRCPASYSDTNGLHSCSLGQTAICSDNFNSMESACRWPDEVSLRSTQPDPHWSSSHNPMLAGIDQKLPGPSTALAWLAQTSKQSSSIPLHTNRNEGVHSSHQMPISNNLQQPNVSKQSMATHFQVVNSAATAVGWPVTTMPPGHTIHSVSSAGTPTPTQTPTPTPTPVSSVPFLHPPSSSSVSNIPACGANQSLGHLSASFGNNLGGRSSIPGMPLSTQPAPPDSQSLLSFLHLTPPGEADLLAQTPWFQALIPREIALELLAKEEIGSFLVRDSATHPGCCALSVRVPNKDNANGITHYLIQRTVRGVSLKLTHLQGYSLVFLRT
ncbi:unnamed protein product [Protopolystoma xenopodis]|uniref:SH2 domain-containing protein n=1 Tax=Protopolystoma xenopodis TaxID=117903 RepID=A0A448WNY1_9PLAT|nr:unnamed protein product [Protopolystoma xenopodis]